MRQIVCVRESPPCSDRVGVCRLEKIEGEARNLIEVKQEQRPLDRVYDGRYIYIYIYIYIYMYIYIYIYI